MPDYGKLLVIAVLDGPLPADARRYDALAVRVGRNDDMPGDWYEASQSLQRLAHAFPELTFGCMHVGEGRDGATSYMTAHAGNVAPIFDERLRAFLGPTNKSDFGVPPRNRGLPFTLDSLFVADKAVRDKRAGFATEEELLELLGRPLDKDAVASPDLAYLSARHARLIEAVLCALVDLGSPRLADVFRAALVDVDAKKFEGAMKAAASWPAFDDVVLPGVLLALNDAQRDRLLTLLALPSLRALENHPDPRLRAILAAFETRQRERRDDGPKWQAKPQDYARWDEGKLPPLQKKRLTKPEALALAKTIPQNVTASNIDSVLSYFDIECKSAAALEAVRGAVLYAVAHHRDPRVAALFERALLDETLGVQAKAAISVWKQEELFRTRIPALLCDDELARTNPQVRALLLDEYGAQWRVEQPAWIADAPPSIHARLARTR